MFHLRAKNPCDEVKPVILRGHKILPRKTLAGTDELLIDEVIVEELDFPMHGQAVMLSDHREYHKEPVDGCPTTRPRSPTENNRFCSG